MIDKYMYITIVFMGVINNLVWEFGLTLYVVPENESFAKGPLYIVRLYHSWSNTIVDSSVLQITISYIYIVIYHIYRVIYYIILYSIILYYSISYYIILSYIIL